jgi:hypothetical protein
VFLSGPAAKENYDQGRAVDNRVRSGDKLEMDLDEGRTMDFDEMD